MPRETEVKLECAVKVPMRDGRHLSAVVYTPVEQHEPASCVCALTPYIADHLHDRGLYFAARGISFIAVDVRGRGNSDGEFRPLLQEAQDGYDLVEWVANQPYCNGKVGMYGGSYLGYAQWATAAQLPPHLSTIVPTAAPYMGVDVPMRSNIVSLSYAQWLTGVSGRAGSDKLSADERFWSRAHRRWLETGRPLREVVHVFGNLSSVLREWLSHPERDDYWDSYNPSRESYARIDIPVLTITGMYDGDQPGALEHYKQHLQSATAGARKSHYLVIGPWNHLGCAFPSEEFDGIKTGASGVLDMLKLHVEWYRWTMMNGERPEFLRDNVAYYVIGANRWRYAPTLEDVTERVEPLHLHSASGAAADVFSSGSLASVPQAESQPDSYIYNPRDLSRAICEAAIDLDRSLVDQTLIHASFGKSLFYHSAPFREDTEVSGFFRFVAWIGIDQRDTDFRVWIYDVDEGGGNVLLTTDSLRARYRESLRRAALIETAEPLRYVFERFTFVSRIIKKGNRLRLVFGPVDSLREERNYNTGGVVCDESADDAKTVTVKLFHDATHPTVLYMPLGRTDSTKQ